MVHHAGADCPRQCSLKTCTRRRRAPSARVTRIIIRHLGCQFTAGIIIAHHAHHSLHPRRKLPQLPTWRASAASWGSLLSDGATEINPVKSYWWLLLYPALVMSMTLLALNFLGDAFRDALDPRARR